VAAVISVGSGPTDVASSLARPDPTASWRLLSGVTRLLAERSGKSVTTTAPLNQPSDELDPSSLSDADRAELVVAADLRTKLTAEFKKWFDPKGCGN